MKAAIFAGPPTSGKTTVIKQAIRGLIPNGHKPSYMKIDVQFADEDAMFREEFGIPARKIHSGDLCPDHCSVLVMGEVIEWAAKSGADTLFVETAGLCLRCAPYLGSCLAVAVLETTGGMNPPRKIGPMLTLADIAVVTKIDLISQAEREVFRIGVEDACDAQVIETDALCGINIPRLARLIESAGEVGDTLTLRGDPPLGVCTICAGKKDVGWKSHYGVVRALDSDLYYRGE